MYRASTGIFSGTTVLRIKRNSQKQNCDFIFLKKWRQNSGVGHPLKNEFIFQQETYIKCFFFIKPV